MQGVFNNKINLLKALAIMIMVAGHLEFSLIPMFPPYSFQVLLFFFIAGMLYNGNYSFFLFVKKRIKSLLIPYFIYSFIYLGITIAAAPFLGKFWGVPVTLKNELILPFLTGHQLDLTAPMWFVPCLFITLIVYKIFSYIKLSDRLKLLIYFILAVCAIYFQQYSRDINFLWLFRTMFALFFVHLGYLYKNCAEEKLNIFSGKIFSFVLILQSLLWLTNKDYTPQDGIGLHFLLVWGEYNNLLVPILTSITGIWMSLFLVELIFDKIKDWKFLHKIGHNTYHIMANHLLIFNIITYSILMIKGVPFDIKNNADIYWFYSPLKTTYFYFLAGIIIPTYIGELAKIIRLGFIKKFIREK